MTPWIHNPVTGEVARLNVVPADSDGRRLEVDLWLQPGAAVARAHVHPQLVERYEVVEGEVGFLVGTDTRVARPGDETVEVPAGTVHDWWNAGDGIAHVKFELAGTAPTPARFLSAIEALWSLGAQGRVNAQGMPDALWLAAIGREYRDVVVFTSPPAAVQATLFPLLAALARRTGRSPLAAELHGPTAPCAIADPGASLASLLSPRVGVSAARKRTAV
jgi:mannose-6-phosphate isomerase-like protein (cupin superfamily)